MLLQGPCSVLDVVNGNQDGGQPIADIRGDHCAASVLRHLLMCNRNPCILLDYLAFSCLLGEALVANESEIQ